MSTPPTNISVAATPTVGLRDAARAFNIGRNNAYELANNGEFPAKVLKVGSRYKVVTASIIRVLSNESVEPKLFGSGSADPTDSHAES